MFHLVEGAKLVEGLGPAADAAGRTSDVISLKDYTRCFIIVHINQGNAATVLLTPEQCTAVAGTGNKAIPAVPIWSDLDCATSDALVARTAAATYTTDAGVARKIVIFQVDAAALDVNGGFDCLRISTGASNAANITAVQFLLAGPRYRQVTPPSAIVD